MEVAVHPADDGELVVDGTSSPGSPGSATSTLTILTAVFAVVAVVCLGVLAYRFVADTDGSSSALDRVGQVFSGSDDAAGAAGDDQALRDEVMSQANQFVLRVNTYGPEDLDEDNKLPTYADGVREVITSKFAVSFDENLTLAEQSVSQAGYARGVELYGTGVESVDEDSATVLVGGVITGSYPDSSAQAEDGARVEYEPQPFRFTVQLVRTDDAWLVDDFAPLTGEIIDPEAPLDPSDVPDPSSTDEPTTDEQQGSGS